MNFRIYNESLRFNERPHPWAERVGNGWQVEINDPRDLLTLAGANGKLVIHADVDEPTISISEREE